MKTLLSALFVLALVFAQPEAQAKRMGGGKSLGQQSSNVTQRGATPPAAPGAPTQNAAAPAKPGRCHAARLQPRQRGQRRLRAPLGA